MKGKKKLIKPLVILFILIITFCHGFAQSSLIHNMDNNNLVNFSEIIENLRGIDKNMSHELGASATRKQ